MPFRRESMLQAAALGVAAIGLAWTANHFAGLDGWPGFLCIFLLGWGLISALRRALRSEKLPVDAWRVTWLAAALRLGVALFLFWMLPQWGYGNPPEVAGYVMADAYTRDTTAWKLAQSDRPLTDAFGGFRKADQYGGLLWLSAAVYRYAGGQVHHPLQMAALAALVSALAVPLGWALTQRAFGASTARWAAWGVALYPEAVLLGSSQMREAFAMPLLAAAAYGGLLLGQGALRRGSAWTAAACLLALPLSPPIAGTALLFAVGTFLGARVERRQAGRWRRVILGVALFAAVVLIALLLSNGQHMAALGNWAQKVAEYQAYLSKQASGWMQKTFRLLPDWMHLPFLVLYGLTRPLLPAALLAGGAPIWWGIAVWRALGWTALLAGLVLAGAQVVSRRVWWQLPGVWWGLIVVQALVVSLRSGGDMWDNPRYRAVLVVPQVALAAWALWQQHRHPSESARRWLLGVALGALWLVPWYVRRYTPLDWAVVSLFKTLALAAVTAVLYVVAVWARRCSNSKSKTLCH